MNNDLQALKPGDPQSDSLPAIEEQALVQAEGFRCLAFRERDGQWKDAFSRGKLRGAIQVIKFG
jgi:hypothetical protein